MLPLQGARGSRSLPSAQHKHSPVSQPNRRCGILPPRWRKRLLVKAAADDAAASPQPEGPAPQEVSLARKFPGAGFTFAVAGLLKMWTFSTPFSSHAPNGCVRTAFGEVSWLVMIPIGLFMCFMAKKIVDSGWLDSARFRIGLLIGCIATYLLSSCLLFRYDPFAARQASSIRTPDMPARAMEQRVQHRDRILENYARHVQQIEESQRTAGLVTDKTLDRQIPKGLLADDPATGIAVQRAGPVISK